MDWIHPEHVFGSGLEAPALRALWRAGTHLTGAQVHRVSGAGTDRGIRYALARLVQHGIVTATPVGGAIAYELNRAHLTFPAIDAAFTTLDPWSQFSSRIHQLADEHFLRSAVDGRWARSDVRVAVFGSVARGDAGLDSDVDLLVVVPEINDAAQSFTDSLTRNGREWTGQTIQVYLTTPALLVAAREMDDPIVASFRADARHILGPDITQLLDGASR